MAKKKLDKQDLEDLGVPTEKVAEVLSQQPITVKAPAVTVKQKQASRQQAVIGGIRPVKIEDKTEAPDELPSSEHELVEILIDEELFVNGQRLFGLMRLPVHQARSVIPMLQSKKRADIEVFTGRSFQVQKTLNNRLVITELNEE